MSKHTGKLVLPVMDSCEYHLNIDGNEVVAVYDPEEETLTISSDDLEIIAEDSETDTDSESEEE